VNRPLVVLDTETANTRGAPHLLELGALRVVDGEVVDQFEALCAPAIPIEPAATEVHGIEDRDIVRAAPAARVLADFIGWLGDDWLVAHDAPRDARVLGFELARCGLEAPGQPWLCTLRLSRKLLPEAADHKLDTLRELLELEDGPRHRALPDAAWCHQVLEACAERAAGSGDATPERLLALTGGAPITIAGHGPAPARMKPRWRPLEGARRDRRELTLLYGSEGQPPAELNVTPWLLYSVDKRGYLEAECTATGTLKTYRLDRIHRVLQPS
jgi:DNA polymerase-3 subunit epsilon